MDEGISPCLICVVDLEMTVNSVYIYGCEISRKETGVLRMCIWVCYVYKI